ncbi:mitochondrial carrier homolog 1 isoform X2 [Varanus komodoensis]|uniref:mitochondrial carrier homolog 1 isoform X2 n=1 Tax=Varanus komodoensis TaxID=61221 RepID=UPI001CF792C9|nr:mitochondrial carrier homolog 1 isoform X2 [Varanus komodoensis]
MSLCLQQLEEIYWEGKCFTYLAFLHMVSIPHKHIVDVDGKRGLFRGLTPRIISSTLSTISRGRIKKAFPLEDMEHVSNKDDVKTSLRKVAKETSHEMMMQCASRVISHPLHVISVRCMVQFVGREVKYRGVFSSIGTIWKEEGLLGFFVGLVPHILGDIIFLWCCNLLAHFINTYAVDDNFNQASVIRSYTKFVMGIAVSMLTYPFLLVGDLMAVNNCGLLAGLHPYAPVFSSWIHCWKHLSAQLCALECSKGPLLFAYSMSSAPISGTVTHSSSKNRDVCLLMGSSELPNGEENWGSSSEVPACFFAEHPHQQPFLLTNHTWKEETNLIYHRRNPKSLL